MRDLTDFERYLMRNLTSRTAGAREVIKGLYKANHCKQFDLAIAKLWEAEELIEKAIYEHGMEDPPKQ